MNPIRTALAALAAAALTATLASCGDDAATSPSPAADRGCVETSEPGVDLFDAKVEPTHSELWDITYHDSYKVLTIPNVELPDEGDLRYVLVQCGTPAPELTGELAGAQVFEVPVQRTMIEHANSLAMLDVLGVTSTIVGMSDNLLRNRGDRWYDGVIAEAGDPANIGGDSQGEGFDYEAMLGLEADLMINGGYGPSYQYSRPQVEAGIPAVLGANRMEPTPLGSAEWMKFFAAFYNREAVANEELAAIEARYEATAAQLAEADVDITAAYLCMGREAGCDFMYAHGPESLNGHLLDALGVTNPFAEGNDRPNGMTFDYERSLARAQDADFFVVYSSPDGVREALHDRRFQQFDALAEGRFVTRTGDNFAECGATSYVRVDSLILDYAVAFAPEQFPGERGRCFAPLPDAEVATS